MTALESRVWSSPRKWPSSWVAIDCVSTVPPLPLAAASSTTNSVLAIPGVIDGAEFVGPGTDIALGLYRVAPLYYYPGFNKPNGTGECIVSLKTWNVLSDELKAVIAHACAAEANYALAEMERLNAQALEVLVNEHKVKLVHAHFGPAGLQILPVVKKLPP